MATIETLEKKIDRLEKIMRDQRPKQTWVTASIITGLTKWNNEQMRTARDNGYVIYKEIKEGNVRKLRYLLESINTQFIKN